ncbi:hypothetical protein HZS_2426, partial [Henneguya salminicola]
SKTITEPPRILLPDCLSRGIPSVLPLIPSYNSLKRNIKIIRQRINLPLTILSEAAHINIAENENFLLYDGLENDGQRFILYATPRQLNILAGAPIVTLIPPSSQRIQQCINSMRLCVNGAKN